MRAVSSVRQRGPRGPMGAPSGPLGSGSVTAATISNSAAEKSAILSKLGGASRDLSNVYGFGEVSSVGTGQAQISLAPDSRFTLDGAAGDEDVCQVSYFRTANYTGGDGGSPANGGNGWVNSVVRVINFIGENARANEWGMIARIENSAPGTGSPIPENAAMYHLARKIVRTDSTATGPTFGCVTELIDMTANPTRSSVSAEIDLTVGGTGNTDNNNSRAILHLAPRTEGGTGNEISKGFYFTPFAGIHIKDMFLYQGFGGTCGNYFNMPAFKVTSTGNQECLSVSVNRSSANPADSAKLAVKIDGVEFGRIYAENDGSVVFAANGPAAVKLNYVTPALEPMSNNFVNSGSASKRWKDTYQVNAAIVSSDGRLKTPLRSFTDDELDAIGEVQLGLYQLLASVEEKGDDARLHAGLIAQDIEEKYAARGLDAGRYGFWCSDPWMETVEEMQPVQIDVMETYPEVREKIVLVDGVAVVEPETHEMQRQVYDYLPVTDADGNPVMLPAIPEKWEWKPKEGAPEGTSDPAWLEKVIVREYQPERPRTHPVKRTETVMRSAKVERQATDPDTGEPMHRLSIRYEQVLIALHAWAQRELHRLASRVAALEGGNAD